MKKEFELEKHFEREMYNVNGIKVMVEIDYDRETISLVEDIGHNHFMNKKYVFGGRGVEYMQGWRNILYAMEKSFSEAEIKLRKHLEKKAKMQEKLLIVALKPEL